ncbi:MAG: rhodanese-like domain-containing protein [Hyphomonadaceae bacterium]
MTRTTMTSLAAITIFALGVSFPAIAADEPPTEPTPTTSAEAISYEGFLGLSNEVYEYRAQRLVSLEDFNRMKNEEDTILFDTRSAAAFEMGHIYGAINLPFSDFTEGKLGEVLPSRDVRILIYCNNNFTDDVMPIILKSAPLALNVPTFINLYGYGYKNIYELGDTVEMADPNVEWVSDYPPELEIGALED